MKVLLGGIPLGCDNIGDEAIVACVVKMLRDSVPCIELTVATADKGTAALLGVEVVPPYGFEGVNVNRFKSAILNYDAFIWCGATGLSDYPHIPLKLLEMAQEAGKATFIWGVGMDDELNPAFFKASGARGKLLSMAGLTGWYEDLLRKRLSKKIRRILPKCNGVWVRDPQSKAMLERTGYSDAQVAADTAILLRPGNSVAAKGGERQLTLGICISTQRQVKDLEGVKRTIEAVRKAGWKVIGIPMNPKTDRKLLTSLSIECIEGSTPEAVIDAAAKCDTVLSSRLHLLILAANAGTQILGIARGSKLANWLANFGRKISGSVQECDWDKVTEEILSSPGKESEWRETRREAYAALDKRLEEARDALAAKLREV